MKRLALLPLATLAVLAAACTDTAQVTQPELAGPALFSVASASGGLTFQSVSAGGQFSCGVTTSGAAYCWGRNPDGQRGDGGGTGVDSNVPVAVSGGHIFQSVSAGSKHTCGVTMSGAAYCWGSNNTGQLGNGSNTRSNVPVAVSGMLTFQSVSAGAQHTCGVTMSGAAYCWGSGNRGQLGNGTWPGDSNEPVPVSGTHVFQSVVADRHSCGVTTSGAAYCWGLNGTGQLGDGTNTLSSVPVAVMGGLAFQSVTIGDQHTCAVTTAGLAYCWGANRDYLDGPVGQLGDGSFTNSSEPVAVSGVLTFQSVAAGSFHTCGVTTSGAYCWGDDSRGQLGIPNLFQTNVPLAVFGDLIFQSVSGGNAHSCGVTTSGAAYCWGANHRGELGSCENNNQGSNRPIPVMFCTPPDDEGPATSNTAAVPNPIVVGSNVDLTANVDDTDLGDSDIASAEYSLDGGAFEGMACFRRRIRRSGRGRRSPASTRPPRQASTTSVCAERTTPATWAIAECIMLVVYDPNRRLRNRRRLD